MAQIKKKAHFIIIDDSELDCFIAGKMIKHSGKSLSIKSFLNAKDALDYISSSTSTDGNLTMLLLDILMPMMNGLQFVEEFEKLPADLQHNYQIVAFTSSMNKKDINTMKNCKSIKLILDKPLTVEILQTILD
jgi:CheY-like chemotaxis protein